MAKTKEATEEKTLTLGDLRPAKGAVKAKLRVGRGHASGAGKTSNRGHRGEGQRSGRSRKPGFEGGQMPLYRRLPKFRRYTPPNQKQWLELNVSDLELFGSEDLTYDYFRDARFLKNRHDGVRILGKGELTRKVKVQAHYVTPSARKKIEDAGGSIELLKLPEGYKREKKAK